MQWQEVRIEVLRAAAEAAADILTGAGAQGVVIEDPRLVNALRGSLSRELCGIAGQADNGTVTLKAYYPDDALLAERLARIDAGLELVQERIGACRVGGVSARSLREEDWANAWKQYFHVTHVGQKFVIKPGWEDYLPQPGEHVITLDPGMAFGTGTHHTTCMCLERLEELPLSGAVLFDVGTGSGILAIAAALLGAAVTAVDIDPVAVRVAAANIAANGLSAEIKLQQGDLLHGVTGRADVIVANIIASVIIGLLPVIPQKLTERGLFVASGIIAERRQEVENAALAAGMRVDAVDERGGWLVMQMSRVK